MLAERYIRAASISKKPRDALCACANCGETTTEEVPWDTELGDLVETTITCDCGEYMTEVIALAHGDLNKLFGGESRDDNHS